MTLTDDFTDELTTHLRERRDALGAAASMPSVDDLLGGRRATIETPIVLPRRRTATIVLAVAAVVLLLTGIVLLTRNDHQRVSTQPAGPSQSLIDDGVPLLFPPDGETPVDAERPRDIGIPVNIDVTIESYVRGKVGDPAQAITLVAVDATGATDPSGSGSGRIGVFSSFRPSTRFDPTTWFADPDSVTSVAPTATDGGFDLSTPDIPGADRAVFADSPDRADVVAIRRGDIEVALFGVGTEPADIVEVARSLTWGEGDDVSVGRVPAGYEPLIPRSSRSSPLGGVSVGWPTGSMTITPTVRAGFAAAGQLSNTGAALPRFTVLRDGPDWVLRGPSEWGQIGGLRDGAWVWIRPSDHHLDDAAALRLFDSLHLVDATTFDRALALGDARNADSISGGAARVADDVKKWGGWIPTVAAGTVPIEIAQTSSQPPRVGGMTGLRPLWEPTTGATFGFADTAQPAAVGATVTDHLILAGTAHGRLTEIRTWGVPESELHAVFTDSTGRSLTVNSTGLTAPTLLAYLDDLTERADGTWTMTVPTGFEPIPLSRTIDATTSRAAAAERGQSINGVVLTIARPGEIPRPDAATQMVPGYRIAISKVDPDIYGDLVAQFFETGPVERMTTAGQTWYRIRNSPTIHQILVPGTAARPMITVSSAERTDDELFDIATTVRPASDDEVDALFASYTG